MRKLATTAMIMLTALAIVFGSLSRPVAASSHREAPLIAYDPQADNTDVYAFVSPDRPDTVTFLANYIPLEEPAGGPNFGEFGQDVLYEIVVVNDVAAGREIAYEFRFRTEVRNPNTFEYNSGTIETLNDPDWNRPQFYSVTRVEYLVGNGKGNSNSKNTCDRTRNGNGNDDGDENDNDNGNNNENRREMKRTRLGFNIPSPPVNIGPRSTPNYPALAAMAVRQLPGGYQVFAGQRDEGFYVDLGAVFDLTGLRQVNPFHIKPLPAELGVDGTGGFNVHTIALQVPISALTRDGSRPTDRNDPRAVIGMYAKASRQSMRVLQSDGTDRYSGKYVQVSRLANPLTNEVLIPVGSKDCWNRQDPLDDQQFERFHLNPEPTRLANVRYPVLDDSAESGRTDIVQIFQTGVPGLNFTGPRRADLLRLNVAIPPTPVPNRLAVLEGDMQGFPNGRRPIDDVVDIEIRAFIEAYGAFAPVINRPNRVPNNTIGDAVDQNDMPFLTTFPYLATPHTGYEHEHHMRGPSSPVGGEVLQ